MITESQLASLGFTPPVVKFTRPDPRGSEYGIYSVTVTKDRITVVCDRNDGGSFTGYAMTFYCESYFTNWVKNTF